MKCYVDTETTGLSEEYCSLLEIAAIIVDDNFEIIDTFHQYINPNRKIPTEIVNLTRITDEMVEDCPRENVILEKFITWLRGYGVDTMIAHNAKFDMKFLIGRSNIWNINHPFDKMNVIDTMVIVTDMLKKKALVTELTPTGRKSKRQESVAKAMGITYGEGGAHSAIEDVTVLMKIHKKMTEMGW